MSNPKHSYIHCMYAEDVRQEHNGQFSVIGVFAGGLRVESVPAQIPKLTVIADVFLPKHEFPKALKLEVMRDGTVLQTIEPGADLLETAKAGGMGPEDDGLSLQMVVGFSCITIDKPGLLQVKVHLDDMVLEGNALKIEVATP